MAGWRGLAPAEKVPLTHNPAIYNQELVLKAFFMAPFVSTRQCQSDPNASISDGVIIVGPPTAC